MGRWCVDSVVMIVVVMMMMIGNGVVCVGPFGRFLPEGWGRDVGTRKECDGGQINAGIHGMVYPYPVPWGQGDGLLVVGKDWTVGTVRWLWLLLEQRLPVHVVVGDRLVQKPPRVSHRGIAEEIVWNGVGMSPPGPGFG